MSIYISSMIDLENWVDEQAGDNVTVPEIAEIVKMIHFDPNSPAWGKDWQEYLDSLGSLTALLKDL